MPRTNNHEQLAKLMQKMKIGIEEHLNQCEALLKSTFQIYQFQYFVSAPSGATLAKWPVIINKRESLVPSSKLFNREHSQLKILRYCPSQFEISEEIDWHENEHEMDSFTYQLRNIHEHCRRDIVIQQNLLKNANPIYERAIIAWEADPDSKDLHAKNPKKLRKIKFAPQEGQSIAHAYEILKKSTRARESRYRNSLRLCYKKLLIEAIFDGIPEEDPIRVFFLKNWEQNIFGKKEKSSTLKRNNVLKQRRGIDYYSQGKCIAQLLDDFIADPTKHQLGEAVCVLLILIWASYEEPYSITVKEVLNLTTQQISSKNSCICFDENKILKISSGLHKFLLCLRGRGVGKRRCRLFKNISNEKLLNRILYNISKKLNFKSPILTASFSIPCHPYLGIRMSITERQTLKNFRQLIPPSSRKLRSQLKTFLKSILVNPSSNSR